MKTLYLISSVLFLLLCPPLHTEADVKIFLDEAEFINALNSAGYDIFKENFDGPAFDSVRSNISDINAAESIVSNEITWSSTDLITTSTSSGYSGYGLYSFKHGIPDSLFGASSRPIFGIGGWIQSNTPPAEINFVLDAVNVVDFNDPIISTQYQFFGLIETSGFTNFEIREIEGTMGDQKFIFIDEFTFAYQDNAANRPPSAEAGDDQTASPGQTVFLNGAASSDPENSTLTFFWEQKNGPAALLSDPTAPNPSFVAPQPDPEGNLLIFTLTVTDGAGLQDEAGVIIYLSTAPALYFPYIATTDGWETEIGLVNKTDEQNIEAVLTGFDKDGNKIAEKLISLAPRARNDLSISQEFTNAESIDYFIFFADADQVSGYSTFSSGGIYRASVPADLRINRNDIHLSHIASIQDVWWTGVALLNVANQAKNLPIEFNDGRSIQLALAPGEQTFFKINDLFEGQSQPAIGSAIIRDGAGIVGLELFGTPSGALSSRGWSYLVGIRLTDKFARRLYYPHIVSDSFWSTGIVAYNPNSMNCNLDLTPYNLSGSALKPLFINLGPGEKYIGTIQQLGFSGESAWFEINAGCKIDALEIFSRRDGLSSGGFRAFESPLSTAVFPILEKNGATGIAFVNTSLEIAQVNINAHDNTGAVIAERIISLEPQEKFVDLAENFFDTDVSEATYVSYSSDHPIAGFQLNMSSDGRMLDGLPGM